MRFVVLAAGAFVSAVSLALLGCGDSKTSGFNGKFRATSNNGPVVLTLETKGDVVTLSMNGETATGKLVSANRVEGRDDNGPIHGTFSLDLDGDKIAATFHLVDGNGATQDVPISFQRFVETPVEGSRDTALVGHWRYTEARTLGPDTSYVNDTHLEFLADGTYATWSKTEGATQSETPRTGGVWKTENKRLYLRPEGGEWFEKGIYAVTTANLMLTYSGGRKQVFEKI